MEAFHNLLREAAGSNHPSRSSMSTSSSGAGSSLPSTASLTQALQAQAMSMTQSMNSMGNLPMNMQLPLPLGNLPGPSTLAPLTGRLGSSMSTSTMFPNLNLPQMPSSSTLTPPLMSATKDKAKPSSAAASMAPVASAASQSKKRKAPSTSSDTASRAGSDSGEKQTDEFEDPKAKRRAQIAKAARKHRQRQKDELIALRAKVKDLKEQIEVLQSSEPSEHNTELGWKQEAEQHAEIRARVDQENEFLRKTLMEQMKFIQRLQDYFAKQPLLNMPSLDLILNASSSSASAPSTLASSIANGASSSMGPPALPSPLQLQAGTASPSASSMSSFQDQLLALVHDAMLHADKQLDACETAFRSPKNPTMTYFGVQVQYDMTKDEMAIFFRHHLLHCTAKRVLHEMWDCIGDEAFEKKFPFVDTVETLEELDADTKYLRRIVNLTVSNENAPTNGNIIKEESLNVIQKRENPDGSIYVVGKSVPQDPNHPKPFDCIRRNQLTTVSLRDVADANGPGCLLLWSVRVFVDKEPDARSKTFNIPDIMLKNLFEIAPVYVKGLVDKARTAASMAPGLR